jgi:integrase
MQRDQGEIVWTPEPPSTLQTAASAASSMSKGTAASDTHSWDALYDDWLRFEPDRRPKTLEDMQRVLREFRALIPKKAPPEITRQNVMAYRDDLVVNKRRKAKTVDKKITFLSALFNVAINHGKLTVNPAARIPKPRDDSARREPFTRDDLQKLFDSVLYSEQQTLGIHTGAASQWLPLLSLFTGCREEELGQLLVDDVQQIDGVWCLLIEASEGKKLKTRNAQRRLPVHPKLIESGWLDYMHRLKKAGQKRLFPALKADRYGTLTAQFSKRFNRYLRSELGIDSPTKVFHSFRHTFRDACREAGLDEELADALMGHASNGKTGRHYGNSFSVQRLQQAIQRIDYPGLEIPKIDVANLPTSSIQSEAKAARTTRRKPSAAAHSGPRPDDRNAAAQPEKPRQSRSKQTKSAATRKAKTPDFAGWYARRRAAKTAR